LINSRSERELALTARKMEAHRLRDEAPVLHVARRRRAPVHDPDELPVTRRTRIVPRETIADAAPERLVDGLAARACAPFDERIGEPASFLRRRRRFLRARLRR